MAKKLVILLAGLTIIYFSQSIFAAPTFCHGQSWLKTDIYPQMLRQKIQVFISPNLKDFIPQNPVHIQIGSKNIPNTFCSDSQTFIDYKGWLSNSSNANYFTTEIKSPIFLSGCEKLVSFYFQKLSNNKAFLQVHFYNSNGEETGEILDTTMDCE